MKEMLRFGKEGKDMRSFEIEGIADLRNCMTSSVLALSLPDFTPSIKARGNATCMDGGSPRFSFQQLRPRLSCSMQTHLANEMGS